MNKQMLQCLNLFLWNCRWVETLQCPKSEHYSVAVTITQGWLNAAQKYCCLLMEKYNISELSVFGLGTDWLLCQEQFDPKPFPAQLYLYF